MKHIFIVLFLLFSTGFKNIFSGELTLNTLAPDFSLRELKTDKLYTLDDLIETQNVTLLSFFNTTCEPCIKEISYLIQLQKKFKDKNFQIYLINIDKITKEILDKFCSQNSIDLPVLMDPYGVQTGEKYNVLKNNIVRLPKLVLINKTGIVKKIIEGLKIEDQSDLEKIINELISEPAEKFTLKQKASLVILFSNSINGNLKSCDCPSAPFGGMDRRKTLVNEIRQKYPNVLVMDSGDILSPYKNELLAEYCLKATKLINYDVLTFGDQEFINGIDFITEKIQQNNLPFISANLSYCEKDKNICNFFEGYKIKQLGDYKIGIIGIISPEVFFFFPKNIKEDLKITSSTEAINTFIKEFTNKVDLIIVLSHSGFDKDKIIADTISGIDVIVGGHSQTFLKTPFISPKNKTIIVQAGEKGEYLGELIFRFNNKKKISSYEYQLIPLDKNIPPDKEMSELLTEYNNKLYLKNKTLLKTPPPY